MMHLLIASVAAAERSPWLGVFGNLHPAVVHFPIALLSVAALFETVQILKKRAEPMPGTRPLAALAAVSACAASLFGWLLEEYSGTSGDTFDLHKYIGFGATAVAIAAALLSIKATCCKGSLIALRITLIVGAGLVGATGYLGGEMVFGKNHILRPFIKKEEHQRVVPFTPTPIAEKNPLLTPAKVSFEKEIAPIIKDMCFKCHGGEKIKGKFKMNTKTAALEGGESGKAILPGKPTLSKFYTSLVDADEDILMPPPKEKARPSKEQIEKVKLWIEQGADWPEGFEFKK